MSTTTGTLSERQADLLKQLEKAGAPTTANSASLDALRSNSLLAKDILEAMGEWKGAVYNFTSSLGVRPNGTGVCK